MKLAKPHIDLGLTTHDREGMLAFWQQRAGLRFDGMLKLGAGRQQLRHDMNGSVLKINHSRERLEEAPPSGYRELFIAREEQQEASQLRDPDGNVVTLVPPGWQDIVGIAVDLAVRDEGAFHRFYGDALGLERCDERAYRCGDSLLRFAHDPGATETHALYAAGYRYMTIQVWDVDAEHAHVLERGGREGRSPLTLGDVARISFVRDPDGNWIELSQRASLTGPLPEARPSSVS